MSPITSRIAPIGRRDDDEASVPNRAPRVVLHRVENGARRARVVTRDVAAHYLDVARALRLAEPHGDRGADQPGADDGDARHV
jgi:hypothetical protein